MICDMHTHSKYSFDSTYSLEEYCRAALDRGITAFATTDHCDMLEGELGYTDYTSKEDARLQEYAYVREKYPELEILYGIEIGNTEYMPEKATEFLAKRDFDFVLGSIHYLPDGSDLYLLPYNNNEEIDAMFREYFSSMLKIIDIGGFDSLAHLDYPLRKLVGKWDDSIIHYRDTVDEILRRIVQKDIALEINTKGFYTAQKRVGPENWVLKRYRELGGKLVTIGSDAHTPLRLGAGFDQAVAALKESGYSEYYIYKNRIPRAIPL